MNQLRNKRMERKQKTMSTEDLSSMKKRDKKTPDHESRLGAKLLVATTYHKPQQDKRGGKIKSTTKPQAGDP
jgi:hypothetical protein